MSHPQIKIDNISIVALYQCEPRELVSFYTRNRDLLQESMPLRSLDFYEEDYWESKIFDYRQSFMNGKSVCFILKSANQTIGIINFDQIIYGAFLSCYLGYALDEKYQGKGIMFKSLQFAMNYVTDELGLNRIMANYVPENYRSAKLLHKLGFEREGYARKYLKLNGVWKDHILTGFIND